MMNGRGAGLAPFTPSDDPREFAGPQQCETSNTRFKERAKKQIINTDRDGGEKKGNSIKKSWRENILESGR